MSGIGKDATRKIFLGNLPMRNSINRIIDEAIEISRSGSTIEEGLDNIDGQATPSDDGNEITEDDIKSRRFKEFSTSFDLCTSSAQKCSENEYCIDLAQDDYVNDNFTNSKNVGWITFRY